MATDLDEHVHLHGKTDDLGFNVAEDPVHGHVVTGLIA